MCWRRGFPLIMLAAALLAGCQRYGEVSPLTYAYAKSLFSVTNQKKAEKLDAIAEQIDRSQAKIELNKQEAIWLHAIMDDAKDGKWNKANRACRRMMVEQIEEP